tara:strand:- start:1635 stop:1988 length:354 start_codon:yes stop_codon:yes gene_type:complete
MSNQENNKMIAEFMRWDIKSLTTIPPNLHLSNLQLDNGDIMELKFHESWDWLMPVVENIESLGYEFFIVEDRIKIAQNTDHSTEIIINFTLGRNYGSKREAVYQGVVEFINEYNKNK